MRFFSLLVQIHTPNIFGNETRQTKHCVSSHEQFNGYSISPKRGVVEYRVVNNDT